MAEMARKKSVIIKILQVLGEGRKGVITQVQFRSYEKDFYKKKLHLKITLACPSSKPTRMIQELIYRTPEQSR